MANQPTPQQPFPSQAAASSDAKPAEPRKPSFPNLKRPEMRALLERQGQTTVLDAAGDPKPYNQFCNDPRCRQALVARSMYTNDPNHTDLVCSWDTSHPQPQLARPDDE